MKIVSFTLEQGNKYYGKIDGQRFHIGNRVPYEGNKGLMNITGTPQQRYDRATYRSQFGFWADFIQPTAVAEGGLFHTLNTYDRAQFTFSFLQFAAHVPNGDFVKYLRQLLSLPLAKDYFPDLTLHNDRICRITDIGNEPLESDISTDKLLDYLNPSTREVEDTEIIQAAKFVHWAQNDPANRQIQVAMGVSHFKEKMIGYARQYKLDGVEDSVCVLVADIRHQGRARSPAIAAALQSARPLDELLKIGEPKYHERLSTLRREIKALTHEGTLGKHRYSLSQETFVSNGSNLPV